MSSRRTPLFDCYSAYGGKVVDYAGWELPIEFDGLSAEHHQVRKNAGLFDVSHMGEITVKGPDTIKLLNYLVTNNCSSLVDNQVLYTPVANFEGGTVDDILVYRFAAEDFLLVVNAANTGKDYDWIMKNIASFDVQVENISDQVSQLAIQGPNAQKILSQFTDTDLSEIKFFHAKRDVFICGKKTMISRTGYTGEDGFEIYLNNNDAPEVFHVLAKAGAKPIGLGARDTLRFEANLPLYGNEYSDEISALEAGYGFFVKLNKEDDFIGKAPLKKQKEDGLKRKVVGFEMVDKGIPRHGYEVYVGDTLIGHVTTGYMAPSVGKTIGMALIDSAYATMGSEFLIQIRNKKVKAVIRDRKFLPR